MAKGISIHIGVTEFEDAAYGNLVDTTSCGFDAKELGAIATKSGFAATVYHDYVDLATVRRAVADAAARLQAGDYFLLTQSSHGFAANGTLPRAWCFSDAKLDRDHTPNSVESVESWLSGFRDGVRILVIANCCFAGPPPGADERKVLVLPPEAADKIASRDLRMVAGPAALFNNAVFAVLRVLPPPPAPRFNSHIYELAACDGNSVAFDGSATNRMCPFTQQVYDLVAANLHGDFDDFMTKLQTACQAASLSDPILTPYEVVNAKYAHVGPYRVA